MVSRTHDLEQIHERLKGYLLGAKFLGLTEESIAVMKEGGRVEVERRGFLPVEDGPVLRVKFVFRGSREETDRVVGMAREMIWAFAQLNNMSDAVRGNLGRRRHPDDVELFAAIRDWHT